MSRHGLVTALAVPWAPTPHPHTRGQPNELRLIGIIVHRNFPEPQLVDEWIAKGVARWGDDGVWYYLESDRALGERLERAGANALALPLNPHWKYALASGPSPKMAWVRQRGKWVWTLVYHERDDSKKMRLSELRNGLDDVLVFMPESNTDWDDAANEHLFLIKRGAKRKRKASTTRRTGRKPVGA